ncbi:MAG: hypothetical protein HUU50_15590 [Candidatus Brocadiae bacterium]|nr:hypothetical protein [Candidatus Brocadiia bacterium]
MKADIRPKYEASNGINSYGETGKTMSIHPYPQLEICSSVKFQNRYNWSSKQTKN